MAPDPWQSDPFESARELAERAAGVLAPESSLLEDVDAAGLGAAFLTTMRSAAAQPTALTRAGLRFGIRMAGLPMATARKALGHSVDPPVTPDPKDRRFASPAWEGNPAFFALRQSYLAAADFLRDLSDSSGVDPVVARKADIATGLLIDALAPTNFALTNPAVLQRALETGGASLVQGARTFVDDVLHNGGKPRQVDSSGFQVGENLACTPAKVVFRNELMELLQYEPQTDHVRARPLLCSPPWINKYYVMDLAPQRSFIEWAVQHGRTVFAISYRNPGADMAGTTMDDYLVNGPQTAINVVQEITQAPVIDIVGLCLGGAMTAITAAYLIQAGDDRVGALTLLNTMLDYSQPGALGAFTDEATVDRLERKMQRSGTLEGETMAGTFDVLRANDLIFNYVVSNWLMGQNPPAFDILAWNGDATRMPAAMHAFYLRQFYVRNALAQGQLEIAGRKIDLSVIKSPTYVVSAINDHIVPWASAYKTVHLVSGPTRFVLGSGGHIAGIVSPPSPKAWYQAAPEGDLPDSSAAWQGLATKHSGSWWQDWARWSDETGGDLVDPPPMGSGTHRVLGPGPGEYVLG